MPNWKQLIQPASGAVPGGIVGKVAIGLIAVLLGAMVLTQMVGGGGEETDVMGTEEAMVTGGGVIESLQGRLDQLGREQTSAAERAGAEAADAELAAEAAFAAGTGDGSAGGAMFPGGPAAPRGYDGLGGAALVTTTAEVELRERLRLEGLERQERSLRAPATVRLRAPGNAFAGAGAPAAVVSEETDGGLLPELGFPEQGGYPGLQPDFEGLARQMEAAQAAALGVGVPGADARQRTVPGVTGPDVAGTAEPVRMRDPEVPAGWERVYEGSVISAVLVTQLAGEFAGPALAEVSVPFYSADRQRILIPRGARLIGTAEDVQNEDQSGLAVGFHRLIWPDGRWVDLSFHGMSEIGESALRDQVDRHYLTMFGAVGAVGLLSGLTMQGGNPYAGGAAGFQASAGQGLGQAATQIMNRFLNRLPTVTIRAGHRIRAWVTADFLVPRPAPHPRRLYR